MVSIWPYLVTGILTFGGIIVYFFFESDLGKLGLFATIIGIVLTFIIAIIQYIDSKKKDGQDNEKYNRLVQIIHDSSEADKKIESLKNLMKQKNVDVNKIIEKFDKPLYSIFIFKYNEVPRGTKKENVTKPLTDLMTKTLKFEIVGNSFYMLLPNNMPNITHDFSIESWTKENIISKLQKNATYTLNFVSLVDLRQVFCYKTVEHGNTIFDILAKDPAFLKRLFESLQKEKISLNDLTKEYQLGDIVTIKINSELIDKLNKNSKTILLTLNCKTVLEICDAPISNLKTEISKYIDSNIDDLVQNLIQNSKALKELF